MPLKESGEDELAVCAQVFFKLRAEEAERFKQDVGDEEIYFGRVVGVGAEGDALAHAVFVGVFAAGGECLRVDVGLPDVLCAEQGGGDAEDAAAAAVVIDGFASQRAVVHQPVEAHRGGWVGAGAEGKAGVKAQDGGIGRVYVVFAGSYPEAAAEVDGAEVVKPGACPFAVGKEAVVQRDVVAECCAQQEVDGFRVAVLRKEASNAGVRPQRHAADGRFVDFFVIGGGVGDGDGACGFERGFDAVGVGVVRAVQGDFQPLCGHGGFLLGFWWGGYVVGDVVGQAPPYGNAAVRGPQAIRPAAAGRCVRQGRVCVRGSGCPCRLY